MKDFFNPYYVWQESRFDVADRTQIQGIEADITNCSRNDNGMLELRLQNKFQKLAFFVGQGNNSRASDQNLTVEVTGNNKQLDIRRVAFNTVQPFEINTAGVNAVQIRFFQDNQVAHCGHDSVQAVFFDATVS